ncbi:MAG: TonB-dependent receptor, partial [Pseudomonadota bacterium]
MRANVTRLSTFLSAASAAALIATGAAAQVEPNEQDSEPAPQTAFPDEDSNVIIVTATRRAENVQDIPIAVTAISPQELERQGVVNIQQLQQIAPSFSVTNAQIASGSNVLRIRGIGTTSNNIGFESAVGIFIDGAYQSRPGVALSEFVDVERVEVLRGPQGTLFGRNTSAGALNITTNRPDTGELSAYANASYGNFDLFSVQGAVNIPIIEDVLATRITGAYRERDGFISITTGGDTNELDQFIVRGQLGYEGNSGLTVRLIGEYSEINGSCCGALELLETPLEAAGAFAAVGLPADGGVDQDFTGIAALDDRDASINFAPNTDIDNYGITGEISFPITDDIEVIYIGSYRDFESLESYDSDFTTLDIVDVDFLNTSIETQTHELRFQGEAFDDRLVWVLGGYYFDEDIETVATLGLGADYGPLIGALLFGPTGGAFGPDPLTLLSGADPTGAFATNQFTQNSESYSIFANATYEIIDGLEFTGGIRYSDETKDGAFVQLDADSPSCAGILANAPGLAAGPVGPLLPTLIGTACFPFTAPADLPGAGLPVAEGGLPTPATFDVPFDDDEVIWTAKLSYEFDAPITVYTSFTHGFKSGGINLDSTAAIDGADPTFLSEEVDAFEIGLKAQFLDDKVTTNIAFFHEDFNNFQVLEFTGLAFETFNVPEALATGVEIEALARPTPDLVFNLGFTYVDARYPSDCAPPDGPINAVNLCGERLTNAPELTVIAGGTYTKEITNYLKGFFNAQVRTVSEERTSTQATFLDSDELLPFDIQTANTKINLSAGIGAIDDRWS